MLVYNNFDDVYNAQAFVTNGFMGNILSYPVTDVLQHPLETLAHPIAKYRQHVVSRASGAQSSRPDEMYAAVNAAFQQIPMAERKVLLRNLQPILLEMADQFFIPPHTIDAYAEGIDAIPLLSPIRGFRNPNDFTTNLLQHAEELLRQGYTTDDILVALQTGTFHTLL